MNDRVGNGAGCFDVQELTDTTELTNVKVAGLGKMESVVIWSEKDRCSSKVKPRLRAECIVLRGQFCILASCCLSLMSRNSVLEELRVSRLAVIQEKICKVSWRWEMLERRSGG